MIEPFLAYYTSICTSYDSARRDILLHGHRLCWSWHYEYIVPHGHSQVIVGCDIHIIDKLNLPPKPLERLSPYVAHSETLHRWIWFLRNLKLSLAADCGQGEHDEHALFQHWLHCQLAVLPRPTLIRDQQSDAGRISLELTNFLLKREHYTEDYPSGTSQSWQKLDQVGYKSFHLIPWAPGWLLLM